MPVTPTALAHAEDLADFVAASPSSYHAAAEVARRLEETGFTRLQEEDGWPAPNGGRYVVVRDGAAIAWVVPTDAAAITPVQIFGAHTDSPGFKLKPQPTTGSRGWLQAAVEVYGGPLLNSWLDRELRLAGRLALADGRVVLADTGPLLRLPQLAIHLERGVNNGLALDKQTETQPVWGLGDPTEADILSELASSAGVSASDIRGYDVVVADSARGAVFGKDNAFFASGRLDDLASVHAGVVALAGHEPKAGGPIAVLAVFDHEELGSESRSGAAGPFLEDVLERVYAGLGADGSARRQAYASSWCLSSDVGHSVHPNYAAKHDPVVQPVLGSGPILKINANQRYATDAIGTASWRNWCERAGVATQEFVSNNSVPCGSTIGPITATRLGIRTVDVGIPILSMHSARELAGVSDLHDLTRTTQSFFAG
ncbi:MULTISPECIES: M18 family aminopeptidase [unclassified Microbacterium]|uniref:M18 family aminopeptidase n=1 Tax=unclassified Microbacterium TaxID=2609290 RepID=UPI000CFE1984|nr:MULTISPECIES: M18 family aminopeptidase [unclassified Microbacterium]PQZ59216.1 M18 family aminopeptidase [Microbacterium sp. MYb43]PQZ81309.1 M18 family aminopeptidase [Microbacterium sp. MYb40]PRB21688.1 M18 family aminopeptidase [Microbacterium sp. MYb54]PRB31447.1 M18 family aminopeptidase [Microbacterium sp. MYb50]PRB68325.1 M18 family aminopeptidase [Microbacterium sp. MYb24]